jgi:hypothetical protein
MKYLFLLFVLVAVALPLAMPAMVHAQTGTEGTGVAIPNPISCGDINCLIGRVIRYILGTIAIVATLMFVWGGFMMLTSGGNAERIKRAKETLAWASIGIVVIMLSWGIIRFVLQGLINSTNTSPTKTVTSGCCVVSGACSISTATACSAGTFHSNQICQPSFGCP